MDDTPMPPIRLDDLDRRRLADALGRGTSRRDMLRLVAALGLTATGAASLLSLPSDARAQAPA
ncbi:MAG: twin-arginine translocation signal domain-containing protein, partial [Betaproteobacteria bacterium]|nr:twin-arginine translocation signal domain-containing protein [Betaproteobacteria bacterium]